MHFLWGAPRGYLNRRKSLISDDTELQDLINEEFPGPMSLYYDDVRSKDDRIRWAILESVDNYRGRYRSLCLERICTTGLTPGDLSRYGQLLENAQNPKVHGDQKR